MPHYRNTDTHTRRWNTLTHPNGGTLELGPGEEVELEDYVDDPILRPVKASKQKAAEKTEPKVDTDDLTGGVDGEPDPSAIPVK